MHRSALATRLTCVALTVCVIVPIARMVFPVVSGTIGAFPFDAIEAVVSTTLGFGLYAVLFG
jgi:hypothetical protein